jgi:basic amino acid/polyamine antiporter, APA family
MPKIDTLSKTMSFWTAIRRRKSVSQVIKSLHDENPHQGTGLSKILGVRDLTAFGIAAIIGAGIFGTIGKASFDGGPAIIGLFIFTGITCGLSAMSYARFAGIAPVSGSAYTYAYLAFGELLAWIIGWDLLLEYAIGNIAVAISWSDYFTGLLSGLGAEVPAWMSLDFLSAKRAFDAGQTGTEAYQAWMDAPRIFGFPLIADLPALGIVVLISWLCYVGIKETRQASNIMVGLKVAVILLVILVGAFYVNPDNWTPFAPNGFSGVMKGVSAVFFAYIGFDAISTTAEECKNPQRDLPRSMFNALLICTGLYILIALVLTGMVPFTELNVGDPLSHVFSLKGIESMSGIVAISAVIAMASVLLVFQLGQPRIWMSMSRDGLLPRRFARLHPKYRTPGFSTIVAGCLVAIPALFMNLSEVTDLTSIGTLFAFVLVNGGVILMDLRDDYPHTRFRIPFIRAWYGLLPILLFMLYWFLSNGDETKQFFGFSGEFHWLITLPRIVLVLTATALMLLSFKQRISLIPVLGMLSCMYLMAELTPENWERFLIWLGIGLIIYFTYGYRKSKIRKAATA